MVRGRLRLKTYHNQLLSKCYGIQIQIAVKHLQQTPRQGMLGRNLKMLCQVHIIDGRSPDEAYFTIILTELVIFLLL